MLRVIIAGFICVSYVMCMTTTHKPHHGHNANHTHHHSNTTMEPPEKDAFRFFYSPHTQLMVVVEAKTCYVFTLSDSEKAAIHTDAGIRAVELRLLSDLSTAALTTTTKDQLDARIAHVCGGHTTEFYKESGI